MIVCFPGEKGHPHIYCKYRSACPIWFMQKRPKGWDAEVDAEKLVRKHGLTSYPGATAGGDAS